MRFASRTVCDGDPSDRATPNHTTIVEPSTVDASIDKTREAMAETGEYATDSWITAKAKSTLLWSSGVSARDISVTTTDGVVALSGMVDNQAEHDLAIELAAQLRGVKRVEASGLTF